jgi:FkbM family methyltransferase
MFNNCDSQTNGEIQFYNYIKDSIKVIFDVGCKYDSEYLNFPGEVHYFDPIERYVDQLSAKENKNEKAVFNKFGLGEKTEEMYYYPSYESFYDRTVSCHRSDDRNKVMLSIKKGDDYVRENKVEKIDFLKIDTEGFELHVLKGFGDFLRNVKYIQFEYGGTFMDNHTKLIDVVDYLRQFDFVDFGYLHPEGIKPIQDYSDHYQYCNIVCRNKNL